jgi:hypothetical protein
MPRMFANGSSGPTKSWGPQRGLFAACLLVGFASLLALDLHFAPAAIVDKEMHDRNSPSGASPSASAVWPSGTQAAARVVLPAQARVPTIIARFDSASKEPSDLSAIRALATAMIEDHDVTILLEGHSDTRGGDDYNHTISLERANWVKSRLVTLGVSADRIETVGLGATRPLRSDDPASASVNRRVEVRWLGGPTSDTAPPVSAPLPRQTPLPRQAPLPRQPSSSDVRPARAKDASADSPSPDVREEPSHKTSSDAEAAIPPPLESPPAGESSEN